MSREMTQRWQISRTAKWLNVMNCWVIRSHFRWYFTMTILKCAILWGRERRSTNSVSIIMLIMWMISIAGMFYFTLVNFSPARSKLLNIYITSIVKTSLLKKYSMKKILEPLVKDLLQLVRLYYNYVQIIIICILQNILFPWNEKLSTW